MQPAADQLNKARRLELVAWIQRSRLADEPFLTCVARQVIVGLFEDGWQQYEIAKALGVSQRVVNYWGAKYQVRPKDQKLLHILKGGVA